MNPPEIDSALWIDQDSLRRERQKARDLRRTQWWKRKLARGICYYCGDAFPPGELTMDHIVPLVRGGKTIKGNCVPACKDCNSRKQSLLPVEWEDYLRVLKEK